MENGLLVMDETANISGLDYLGSNEQEYPDPKVKACDNLIEYNQYSVKGMSSSCTVTNPACALFTNLGLSEKKLHERLPLTRKKAQGLGAKQPGGRYTMSGVNVNRNDANENKDYYGLKSYENIESQRTTRYDDLVWDLLKKGYCIVGSFKGDYSYTKDQRDNGIIEGVKFGSTRGHCIMYASDGKVNIEGHNPQARDSAKGTPHNQYTFKDFISLVDNGTIYKNCYFYYIKSDKSEFDLEFDEAIKLGITTGKSPNRSATRKECAVMNLRVYKMLKA